MSTRQTTFDLLQSWEKCTPGDPDSCIIEPGNPKDCTGVLTCPFAINPASRMAAEGQMLVMGEQSRGCYQCSVPSCLAGNIPICEPVSKHCYIVESIIGDAAIITPGGGSNDAGGLSSIDNDASP